MKLCDIVTHIASKRDQIMRNYLFSIGTHIVILLLLLGLSFTTLSSKKPEQEMHHIIMVDFSADENQQQVQTKSAPAKRTKKVKQATSSPQKKPAAVQKKTSEKPLRRSQKPKGAETKVVEEKSTIVEKVVPHTDQPSPQEIEAERREKEKAEKRSKFASLLSRAKSTAATSDDQPETKEEASGATSTGASSSIHNKNIRGVLGNRQVLKTPVIKDQSQKKGRVVVKICVGSDGKVQSSRYTMMGSTTSDTYLINLAEKGASQYLFSSSPNAKECGNVVIDFQLK